MNKKEAKSQEDRKALAEYFATARATDDKTARLRALRLASSEAAASAPPLEKPKKRPAARKAVAGAAKTPAARARPRVKA